MPPVPSSVWRLIRSGYLSAPENMAVDEALFESVAAGGPPVLRVYGWAPPGVSLGCFQALDERVNVAAVRRRGYGLVRRPTGGRAIIHHHEVTYSVAIRAEHLAGGESVLRSYRELSRGIEAGLARLGMAAAIPDQRPAARPLRRDLPTVCFAKAMAGDMTVEGRKVVGSAQMRRRGTILQHGAIPLHIDVAEHLEILGSGASDPEAGEAALARAAVGVADALGREVSFEELGQAVVAGFADALAIAIDEDTLSPGEADRARELVRTRYASEAWTRTPGKRA